MPSSPCQPTRQISGSSTNPTKPATQPTNNVQTYNLQPAYQSLLQHLATPLRPFVSCVEGQTHPDFPLNLLSYHLLTSTQLDNLARHYHQVSPSVAETTWYPNTIPAWIGTSEESSLELETKRRRFGRFIGLQGCESPIIEHARPLQCDPLVYRPELDFGESFLFDLLSEIIAENETETPDQILERMGRETQEALKRAQEEETRLGRK